MKTRGTDREFPRYGAAEHADNGAEINQIPPEFNEVRPDIHFFNEMPMADREHISGNGNPEEGDAPPKKEKQQKRQGALRSLLKSVGKGVASAVAAAALVVVTAEAVAPDSAAAQRVRELILPLRERAVVRTQTAVDPEGYARLWNDEPNAPHDYDYDSAFVEKEPSCTEDGTYRMVCRQCGEINTVVIPALGHTPGEETEENRTEPDCTEDGGYERAVYCSICGEELGRETVVLAAAGHTPDEAVEENFVGTDCTTGGSYDSVVYCSVCGEELSRETITFAAAGHTPGDAAEENRTEASCDTEGRYDRVVYCSVCGEELSRETVVFAALGHTPSAAAEENRTEAGCVTDGSYDRVVYCSVCGAELERTAVVIPAAGAHTAGAAAEENRMEATCVTDGHYDTVVYCTVCGEEVSRETVTITAAGHTPGETARENEQDATCTAEGSYDTVTRCTVCNEIVTSEHTTIAALGHDYGELHFGHLEEDEDHALKCSRCGTYALTCSFVNSNTVRYSVDPTFVAQAAAMGAGMMEFDVLAYTEPDRSFASWIGGFGNEVTETSGTFTCDFAERDETLYYEITMRFAEDGGADDIIYLWPSGGQYMTYMP